jgi:hypothetical protein
MLHDLHDLHFNYLSLIISSICVWSLQAAAVFVSAEPVIVISGLNGCV